MAELPKHASAREDIDGGVRPIRKESVFEDFIHSEEPTDAEILTVFPRGSV